ncbi:MAG: nickel-responsive transcriptional regulator NikR [Nitrospinae bacterium]|nr:nickel-responsive transcriptional regulator NikR [Nitrospinota bacterium]
MSKLTRLSFTIEKSLFDRLERLAKKSRYENRSEFIRDLIRDRLVEEEWEAGQEALGVITLIYDHHARGVAHKLTSIQHKRHTHALAATHVHLDERLCAEMILLRGRAGEIRAIADEMRRLKGVLHARLSMSSTGKGLT